MTGSNGAADGGAHAKQPTARTSPQVLKDLRSLHVCMFHPLDRDAQLLTQQLQRIGCQVHCFWPPPDAPVPGTDLVIIGLYPDSIGHNFAWCDSDDAPPVVAVINYENPTIIDAVLRVGAKAVIASPIRSFGILSALVLATQIARDLKNSKSGSRGSKKRSAVRARSLKPRRSSCGNVA